MMMPLVYENGIGASGVSSFESCGCPLLSGSRLLTGPPRVPTTSGRLSAATWAGVTPVRLVPAALTLTPVTAAPPIVTVVPVVENPTPLTVIACPPEAALLVGRTLVIRGRT